MTVSSGFFNSVNHDRLYDAEQLSSIFDGIILDGVYENYGEALNVTAYPDANSTVIIGTGRAWFDHTWTLNDSQFTITLDPPNEMLDRTDAIVVDIDKRQDVRKNSIIYVKGNEATSQLPPILIKEDLHKQYPIAYVFRKAGGNAPVEQSQITIKVGSADCPVVTGILEAQNLENLMQQLGDEFNTWWEGIKAVLDDNIATNLQNQIDEINAKLNSETALVGLLEKPIADVFMSGDYKLTSFSYSISYEDFARTNTANASKPQDIRYVNSMPFAALLPDGKCVVGGFTGHGAYDYVPLGCSIRLYTTDGTHTDTTYLMKTIKDDPGQGVDPDLTYSPRFVCYPINVQLDEYPVSFTFIGYTNDDYEPISSSGIRYYSIVGCKVTITSDGSIYFDELPYTTANKTTTLRGSQGSYYVKKTGNDQPSIIFGANDSDAVDDTTYAAKATGIVWKITSDGVISHGSQSSNLVESYLGQGSMGGFMEIHDDKAYYYLPDSNTYTNPYNGEVKQMCAAKVTIDINNYQAQCEIFDASEEAPYRTVAASNASSYVLSEKEGVVATQYVKGGDPVANTGVKISPYFSGASNSSSGLVEGTYTAFPFTDTGCLIGVGPGGEQIAIGSNGGAATLKNTVSIGSTINLNLLPIWTTCYVPSNDGVTILLRQNDSWEPKTVVRISKG